MSYIHESYVLKPKDSEKESISIVAEVRALLSVHKVDASTRYDDSVEDPGSAALEHLWDASDGGSQLRFVDEGREGGKYFTISAPDHAKCAVVASILGEAFSFWTVSELVSQAGAVGAAPYWITLAAIATNEEFDDEVFALIVSNLRSSSTKTRNQAAVAAGLVMWPDLLPALRSAYVVERDAGVKGILGFDIDLIQEGL